MRGGGGKGRERHQETERGREKEMEATGVFYDDDKPQISDDFTAKTRSAAAAGEAAGKRGELSSLGRRVQYQKNFKYCQQKQQRERAWHFQLIKVLRLQLTESFDPDGAA